MFLTCSDSDAHGVISKIIKSKKKMFCPAKVVNNPCIAQNAVNLGRQIISNVGTGASPDEYCTGNLSGASAEPVTLVQASAPLNLEQLIVCSTSSKKRKRKSKEAENKVGIDAP